MCHLTGLISASLLQSTSERIETVGNDTDVLVITCLLITTLHVLANNLGQPMCEVLPAVHALTGCDVTSKFRTKSAGIKADPSMYLKDFGKLEGDVPETLRNAEKYSVQVLKRGNHGTKTLDNLRYNMYHQRKSTSISI